MLNITSEIWRRFQREYFINAGFTQKVNNKNLWLFISCVQIALYISCCQSLSIPHTENDCNKPRGIRIFLKILSWNFKFWKHNLTLSRWRSPSYRNQSIDFHSKSLDWFLYDRDLRHERVDSWPWPHSIHSIRRS